MKLNHLRYFLILFQKQQFGSAAKRCGVAQPTLSMAIKKLEHDLGGPLFLRRPRCKTTPLAIHMQPFLEKICQAATTAEREAERFQKSK